ncbi:DUF5071 domain-containing protein [Paenibacillus glufosinatiresistens]|uniref:DUF5071 domain-containing protein n=1 Tax=Paenibacillus glufosinatiresistens TaxID=3070657 RepID=UPI00286EB0FE|nr:DUF5071 domain-containing protein [Paenibacillus sp. YX.27]
MDVRELIPKDKMDTDSVNKLKNLDVRLLRDLVPDLLEWTQDCNWPVARDIGELLLPLGHELIPYLREIFASDDDCWKYAILVELVKKLPMAVLAEMEPDLRRLAFHPTRGERDELAAEEAAEILAHMEKYDKFEL